MEIDSQIILKETRKYTTLKHLLIE